MGNGIAHVVSLAGYNVLMNDLKKEAVDKALATIERNMARQVSRGLIKDAEMQQALKRISYAPDMAAVGQADLVIEAATEDESVKRKIFADLLPQLKKGAMLASNTSSISITRLASATDRPERFIGMHFMNPVPMMQLVELIRGIATEDETFGAARQFVESLGKVTAVSEDFPAFIVNRILLPMINEAVYTLYEGVGTVESIDKAMRLGANHPMGPLELADFIGLDTCLSVMQVLYEGLADSKYRPCPLLVKYVEAGWLGRKTQRGFYDYRGDKPVPDAVSAGRSAPASWPKAIDIFPRFGVPAFADRWPTIPTAPQLAIGGLVEAPMSLPLERARRSAAPRDGRRLPLRHDLDAAGPALEWLSAGRRARSRSLRRKARPSAVGHDTSSSSRSTATRAASTGATSMQRPCLRTSSMASRCRSSTARRCASLRPRSTATRAPSTSAASTSSPTTPAAAPSARRSRIRAAGSRYEERGRFLPGWVYRHIYRALVPGTLAHFERAAQRRQQGSRATS